MATLLRMNLFFTLIICIDKCDFVNNSISYRGNSLRKVLAIDFHDTDYFQNIDIKPALI